MSDLKHPALGAIGWRENVGEKKMDKKKESFKPYISADKVLPEFTVTSILMGIILAVLFGAANAYNSLSVYCTDYTEKTEKQTMKGRTSNLTNSERSLRPNAFNETTSIGMLSISFAIA